MTVSCAAVSIQGLDVNSQSSANHVTFDFQAGKTTGTGFIIYFYGTDNTPLNFSIPNTVEEIKPVIRELGRVENRVLVVKMNEAPENPVQISVTSTNGDSLVGRVHILVIPVSSEEMASMDSFIPQVGELAVALACVSESSGEWQAAVSKSSSLDDRLGNVEKLVVENIFTSGTGEVVLPAVGGVFESPMDYPPFYAEMVAFTPSKNPGFYRFEIGFAPNQSAGCEKSINASVFDSSFEIGDETLYEVKEKFIDFEKLDEMPALQCDYIASVTLGNSSKLSTLVFKRIFDSKESGLGSDRGLSVYYHSGDALVPRAIDEIVSDYNYELTRLGSTPEGVSVNLFSSNQEMYGRTGVLLRGIAYSGVGFFDSKQIPNCPTTAAHELQHTFFSMNYEGQSKNGNFFQGSLSSSDTQPLNFFDVPWIYEGIADYFASDATAYSPEEGDFLYLLEQRYPDNSGKVDQLTDLDQIINIRTEDLESPFKEDLAYLGGAAFLDYLEGRFGTKKVDLFFDNLRTEEKTRALGPTKNQVDLNAVKTALRAAVGLDYPTLRIDFNQALNGLHHTFPVAPIDPNTLTLVRRETDPDRIAEENDNSDCKTSDHATALQSQSRLNQITRMLKQNCPDQAAVMASFQEKPAQPVTQMIKTYGFLDSLPSQCFPAKDSLYEKLPEK